MAICTGLLLVFGIFQSRYLPSDIWDGSPVFGDAGALEQIVYPIPQHNFYELSLSTSPPSTCPCATCS